jgi:hypothetical protein
MQKQRVLQLNLSGLIEAFAGKKWKFFDIDENKKMVTVEDRISDRESYIVELSYANEAELDDIEKKLIDAGFIQQKIRIVSLY